MSSEDPKAFITRRQKMVLEADNLDARRAALREIFDPDLKVVLNGKELGWPWFEEHMIQLENRLKDVEVTVTHAVREGNVLMERHVIHARDTEKGEPWVMEVMGAYELTPEDKIVRHFELTNMVEGIYEGGW